MRTGPQASPGQQWALFRRMQCETCLPSGPTPCCRPRDAVSGSDTRGSSTVASGESLSLRGLRRAPEASDRPARAGFLRLGLRMGQRRAGLGSPCLPCLSRGPASGIAGWCKGHWGDNRRAGAGVLAMCGQATGVSHPAGCPHN